MDFKFGCILAPPGEVLKTLCAQNISQTNEINIAEAKTHSIQKKNNQEMMPVCAKEEKHSFKTCQITTLKPLSKISYPLKREKRP